MAREITRVVIRGWGLGRGRGGGAGRGGGGRREERERERGERERERGERREREASTWGHAYATLRAHAFINKKKGYSVSLLGENSKVVDGRRL